jgi:hypothetical protein
MFEYLNTEATNDQGKITPNVKYEPEFDLRELRSFPRDRFLCIVGTNHADYEVFHGYWKHAVGPGSDGLVRIENAWVDGMPRVDIHRSHSGRYGIVNSNESYQEMQRFLFGDWRVAVDLVGGEPVDPGDGGHAHLLDVECSLGRRSVLLSSRKAEHLNAFELTGDGACIHVFHLLASDLEIDDEPDRETIPRGGPSSFRLKLSLRLRHDRYDGEQESLTFSDLLMEQPVEIRINPHEEPAEVSYRWPNTMGWPTEGIVWQRAEREGSPYVIPIPPGRSEETWGRGARLYLTMNRWNEGEEDSLLKEFVPKVNESSRTRKKRRHRERTHDRAPVGAD